MPSMSSHVLRLLIALALAVSAPAQRHKLAAINAETEEGKVLQASGQEADPAKKLGLMEQFVTQFPTHAASGWVYTQMQTAYVKGNSPEKAVATGEKLLTLDPMDIEAAYGNLKASEAKKDADGVLKWSSVTSAIARK